MHLRVIGLVDEELGDPESDSALGDYSGGCCSLLTGTWWGLFLDCGVAPTGNVLVI